VQLSGTSLDPTVEDPAALASWSWTLLGPRRRVLPDTPHRFRVGQAAPELTHLRVDIYPDGGFARLRAHGELTLAGYNVAVRRWLDALPASHLREVLIGAGLDPALAAGTPQLRGRRPEWAAEVLAAFAPG
jgi:allantoicase